MEVRIHTMQSCGSGKIVYIEVDRNGKPYINRMIVTYVLEKINGNWYIEKGNASSVEKSTDRR